MWYDEPCQGGQVSHQEDVHGVYPTYEDTVQDSAMGLRCLLVGVDILRRNLRTFEAKKKKEKKKDWFFLRIEQRIMNFKESPTDVTSVDKWLMRNPVGTASEYLLPERDALTSQWGKPEAGILTKCSSYQCGKWLVRVTQWQEEGQTEEDGCMQYSGA